MSKSKFNPLITASVMSAVYLAGVSHDSHAVVVENQASDLKASLTEVYSTTDNHSLPAANALGQRRYIIEFNQPSVARYNGNGQFAPIPRLSNHKIDVNSAAVQSYVSMLDVEHTDFLNGLSSQLGRSVDAIASFKYAVNGLALYLTTDEVASVKSNANVKSVSLDRNYFLDTDAGPTLIGANNVWVGNAPATGQAFGEGIVLGIIDSGANFDHPSFADIGGDGYDHTNPLGAGNYLGACDPSNADQFIADYTCNDKLIGGYDFVSGEVGPGDTEVVGPEDENGHGTHTASTAGGNLVLTASANGVDDIEISGVARHANIVVYDACLTISTGQGTCPGVSLVSSIDQVIADGIIDVVNYSISGGTSPWTDTISQGFLAATDNGIFVSASAGNSGPGAGTLGHVEPWTSTVAASTHNRDFESLLSIVGQAPPLADIAWNSSNGPDASGLFNAPIPINSSTNVDVANFEGCNPFPVSSFAGQIALISRGACSFADKVANATIGDAIGVIIYNNVAGPLNMNVGDATTIPSISISQVDGDAIVAFLAPPAPAPQGGGGPEVLIAAPVIVLDAQADVMAGFSSRGPSPFEVNKPDVTAPGVSILAAFNDNEVLPTVPDEEYGIISGTSMSSPHNAGAAALLKELQPTWTAPEIKSALMMTAVTAGVTKEDATTPADPFDRGAGRIQVDLASSAGLVMHETSFDFLLADPANGGDPKTLNLPSYKNDNCVGTCSFTREFRSVADAPVNYSASLSGMTGTVSPATFTAMPGQTVILDVEIDGAALPAGATSFGELQISEVVDTFVPGGTFDLGAPIAIQDETYDGTTASMDCSAINVTGLTASAFTAEIEMGIDHTWIGDLTLKLINPNGDELAMMNDVSDSSNLLATSPITFIDGGAISAANMGDNIGGGEVVCQDDLECEFSPAPNGEPEPPSNFADLGTGAINGDWMLCGGDSAGGDTGTIQSATLTVLEGVTSVPPLHLPLVVVGLPEAPDITVTPASLSSTQDADTTADLNLNISNSDLAGADLNWSFGAGTFAQVFAEQAVNGTQGIISDFYTPEAAGVYSSDDFTLTGDASIENMFFGGFVLNGQTLNDIASSIEVRIYDDNAGVPNGHPDDGVPAVVELSIPINDPSLDLTGSNIGIDVVAANGGAIDLPAGTYWVVAYAVNTAGFGVTDRWNWFAGVTTDSTLAVLIDPSDLFLGGFTDWTDLLALTGEATLAGLNYSLSGNAQCGAPWITTSTGGGVVSPGNGEDVTVTLDATGVSAGVYTANLCVDSDDPDEPQVLVPVTMTVEGLSDIIFENGFEAP